MTPTSDWMFLLFNVQVALYLPFGKPLAIKSSISGSETYRSPSSICWLAYCAKFGYSSNACCAICCLFLRLLEELCKSVPGAINLEITPRGVGELGDVDDSTSNAVVEWLKMLSSSRCMNG